MPAIQSNSLLSPLHLPEIFAKLCPYLAKGNEHAGTQSYPGAGLTTWP